MKYIEGLYFNSTNRSLIHCTSIKMKCLVKRKFSYLTPKNVTGKGIVFINTHIGGKVNNEQHNICLLKRDCLVSHTQVATFRWNLPPSFCRLSVTLTIDSKRYSNMTIFFYQNIRHHIPEDHPRNNMTLAVYRGYSWHALCDKEIEYRQG